MPFDKTPHDRLQPGCRDAVLPGPVTRAKRKIIGMMLGLCIGFSCAGGQDAHARGRRWMPDSVAVDTVGYEYEINPPLSDGFREPRYWREVWMSRETHNEPHWAELTFTSSVPVEAVAIHWAVEDGHPKASGKPTTSREYRIQVWLDGEYRDAVQVSDHPPASRSVHVFDRVSTERVRVWQPAGGGPAFRTNAMWIAEIEVYDYPKAESDFGMAADDEEVRIIRAASRERTIGVYLRARHHRQGWTTSISRSLSQAGWRTIGLDRLDERSLER